MDSILWQGNKILWRNCPLWLSHVEMGKCYTIRVCLTERKILFKFPVLIECSQLFFIGKDISRTTGPRSGSFFCLIVLMKCWNDKILSWLKNNSLSQSCCTHLFFGVRLIQQNSSLYFFSFLNFLSKIYIKRYERHNKTHWTKKNLNLCALI